MDLQDGSVSTTSSRWDSTETLSFSDSYSDTELDFVKENSCCVCRQRHTISMCIEISNQWLERGICVIICRNKVFLKCRQCTNLYHLGCLRETVSVDDIRMYTEEDYCCSTCREEGRVKKCLRFI